MSDSHLIALVKGPERYIFTYSVVRGNVVDYHGGYASAVRSES